MGLFDVFKKDSKKDQLEITAQAGVLYAPVDGSYIPLEQVPDETFAQGMLGKGCGFHPTSGRVYSPVDGTIAVIACTKHAIGLTGADGAEYLIHIGMDTVHLNGQGFLVKVSEEESVKAGQLLMEFDMGAIKRAGYTLTSAFVVTNYDEYPGFVMWTDKTYSAGDPMGEMK